MKVGFRVVFAACLVAGVHHDAAAQTAQLYGLLDTGVEYLTNTRTADGGKTYLLRLPNLTGLLPSRIGFRGSEDIGGGVKVNFKIEAGVFVDEGGLTNGGRLFGRESWVGLSGPYGEFQIGRGWTMMFDALVVHLVTGLNLYQVSSMDPDVGNPRSDNIVSYRHKIGPFPFGASYSFGRDTSSAPGAANCPGENGNHKACREWSVMGGYVEGPVVVHAFYDQKNGDVGGADGLSSPDFDARRSGLAGTLRIGPGRVTLGWIGRRIATAAVARFDTFYGGGAYPVTSSLTLVGQVSHQDRKDSPADSTLYCVQAVYTLSKRTDAYVQMGYIRNRDSAAVGLSPGVATLPGTDQTGVNVGLRHIF